VTGKAMRSIVLDPLHQRHFRSATPSSVAIMRHFDTLSLLPLGTALEASSCHDLQGSGQAVIGIQSNTCMQRRPPNAKPGFGEKCDSDKRSIDVGN